MLSLISVYQSEPGGLTLREVFANIPSDPASVFVYLILFGALFWVIWGSRRKGKPSS